MSFKYLPYDCKVCWKKARETCNRVYQSWYWPYLMLIPTLLQYQDHQPIKSLKNWNVNNDTNILQSECGVILYMANTVEPRLSGPRLTGLFDYPDFFSGPVFFMNINKL